MDRAEICEATRPRGKRPSPAIWPLPQHMNEAGIMSAVYRALYQEETPTHIRIFSLRRNEKGTLRGLITPFTPMEQLLLYRDTVLRAARKVGSGNVDIQANETWR